MKIKTAKNLLLVLLITLVAASTLGCATRDRRDAPWDPDLRRGQTLFDQMPNWDDAADRLCCGRKRECSPGQTPRC